MLRLVSGSARRPVAHDVSTALVQGSICGVMAAAGPDRLLAGVARGAARLCRAPLAAVALPGRSAEELEVLAVFGTGGVIAERRLPVGESLNGGVLRSARSFRSADVAGDHRGLVREIARRNRIRGVLVTPLLTRDRVIGTLAVARRTAWEFSGRDEAILEAFALRVAGAIASTCLDGRPVAGPTVPRGLRPTDRERDLLLLLATGRTYAEAGAVLGVRTDDVRHTVERLMFRWGKTTLHGVLAFACERGVLPPT